MPRFGAAILVSLQTRLFNPAQDGPLKNIYKIRLDKSVLVF